MHGTFNGLRLNRIIALKTTSAAGRKRTTFRVLEQLKPELKERLQLNAPALLILSSQEIEGELIDYREEPSAFEVTIETRE